MKPPICILVVEDEPFIQSMVEEVLRDDGYDVITASTGEDAIRILEDGLKPGVLVTDINLMRGGVMGWDVANRARQLSSDMHIVYMTGLNGKDWPALGVPDSVLIAKPFTPEQMLAAVVRRLNCKGEREDVPRAGGKL